MTRFVDALNAGVLVADGGMGSMCHQVVEGPIRCVDELCLTHSAKVLGIHLRFIQAGARIIETNSFGANRAKLARFGLQDRTIEINAKAVKLAREAREIAGTDVFIAGSIGPTGMRLRRTDEQGDELFEIFREQAIALDERGVDVFILETFPWAWELEQAVRAVRSVTDLPIVAQITFPAVDNWTGEEKVLPRWATEAFQRLDALGCVAVGANCTLGPGEMLDAVSLMAATLDGSRLAIQPNSGLPRVEAGRFIYPDSSAEYFAWFAREAVKRGARIVGGCCGTTPAHIQAMAEAVKSWTAKEETVRVVAPPAQTTGDVSTIERVTGRLGTMLDAGEFVVSMQVDPPKGTNPQMILDACQAFRESGLVDVVDVNSNPMARLHMDALWMSSMIEGIGLETVPHYTPRDASKMGIEGNLLGAWAVGIRNVLVITGDPSVVAGEPRGHDVYQTDSIGMVEYIAQLNRGIDCYGNAIGTPPNFRIGVAVNPAHDSLDLEVERFLSKVEAGAHFAMTQVFFDWSHWERFMDRLGGQSPIPILVAVWPLTSHRLALRLHNEVPGIVVPDWLLEKLDKAGRKARFEGRAVARELLAEARLRADGAYIIAPFKKPKAALRVLTDVVP